MVFGRVKPNNWQINEKLTSSQMNQIDTNVSSSIDKTGETSAGGGGVTGEIDFKSGSELIFQSGSVVSTASGSGFTFQSGSSLTQNGILYQTLKTITTTYSVDTGGQDFMLMLNGSSSFTITLPSIGTQTSRTLVFKDITGALETNPVTLSTSGGNTIEGASATTRLLQSNFGQWTLVADNTIWYIIK
jgi:gp9/10-like protein